MRLASRGRAPPLQIMLAAVAVAVASSSPAAQGRVVTAGEKCKCFMCLCDLDPHPQPPDAPATPTTHHPPPPVPSPPPPSPPPPSPSPPPPALPASYYPPVEPYYPHQPYGGGGEGYPWQGGYPTTYYGPPAAEMYPRDRASKSGAAPREGGGHGRSRLLLAVTVAAGVLPLLVGCV